MQPLWKTVLWFLKKLKIELLHRPAIPLLGIYPKEIKSVTSQISALPCSNAALFTKAKIQEQHKCLLTNEWIKKMWYILTMEYYLIIKKKEILPFVTIWMNLEDIIVSEISQTQKDKCCMISIICGI